MMDSGETAQAAPKGKRRTLRQDVYKRQGEYMTSIEMQGFSISLLRLDDQLRELLDAPADTPAWK